MSSTAPPATNDDSDDEAPVTYTDKQVFWNDEQLHAAFLRQNKTRLLEIHVVLAEQSGDYPPGELFEIVTKYDGVAVELLRTLQDTNDVLIKSYSSNEGVLEVLVEAGIVSRPLAQIPTSRFTRLNRCRVLVELPELVRGTKPGMAMPASDDEQTERSTSTRADDGEKGKKRKMDDENE